MQNFCHNAFLGLNIAPDGHLKPCCKFSPTEIPKFNVKDGIDRYKNSEWLKNLQTQFLDGEKPKGCDRCWKEEEAGIQSKRQMDYKNYRKDFDRADLKKTDFINITMSFGNLCNLACRICSPESSSRWASEKKNEDGKNYPIWDWLKNTKIMEDIYNQTKNLVLLDIIGGEPLLTENEEHLKYLEKFISDGTAKKINLHYISNGTTLIPQTYLEIWNKFKKVELQLSIDDTEGRFEYNRWPARWDRVYTNIKRYQKLSKENKNIRLSIAHSISVFTILYAEQFFKWCIRERLPAPWMGLVSRPTYYNPSVLPVEVREKISSILEQSKIKKVRKLKDYLQYDNSQYFNQFLSITRQLDTIRNQNFQTTFPELAELIRHYI
jgi:MoaA/NifB/PqqE/SkfB family radical SAM enzyme